MYPTMTNDKRGICTFYLPCIQDQRSKSILDLIDGKPKEKQVHHAWPTSNNPVLVVTTSMSELLSSSVTVSSSSVGVADLNWKGVLAPLMSPACVT